MKSLIVLKSFPNWTAVYNHQREMQKGDKSRNSHVLQHCCACHKDEWKSSGIIKGLAFLGRLVWQRGCCRGPFILEQDGM
eukprot:5902867-Ditylum_brightwellii.AAC.1